MPVQSHCPHVVDAVISYCEAEARLQEPCSTCSYAGGSRWLCLRNQCFYVGCGRNKANHALEHFKDHNHELQLNVKTLRVWCMACDDEVFPNNAPPWNFLATGQKKSGRRKSPAKITVGKDESTSEFRPVLPKKRRMPKRETTTTTTTTTIADKQSHVPYQSLEKISIADELSNRLSGQALNAVCAGSVVTRAKKAGLSNSNLATDHNVPNLIAAGRLFNERERITAVPDYLSESAAKERETRGLVGLRNLGNTCYMNAVLQCLSNCPPFTDYVLSCRLPVDYRSCCLALAFGKLVAQVWSAERTPPYLVPVDLLQIMRSLYPSFRGYQQQDAQEFLRCFLDALHEDLKQPVFEWELRQQNASFWKRGRVSSEDRTDDNDAVASSSSVDGDVYKTCDSGWSSDSGITQASTSTHSMTLRRRRAVKSECFDLPTTKESTNRRTESNVDFFEANADLATLPTISTNRRAPRRQKAVRCSPERVPRHKPLHFRSIVSDVFDGRLLSSVQCLTCNTISETRETFQDLSLPIPSLQQVELIKNSRRNISAAQTNGIESDKGWFWWAYDWFKSWLSGPKITLEDCLAAFFSADDLKGDDMYSCDRCKKLRNGVKFCSLLSLPEVLCIHLKRFRHESIYSSKISTYIDFPLENLNMAPFLHKNAIDEVHTYDLMAVICHRGGVEGGHYTAYCMNPFNATWYEFDDQYATEVDVCTVKWAEAYVLFYRKNSDKMDRLRDEIFQGLNSAKASSTVYYLSREWLHRFNTFAEPGPITNFDFLCPHGWISPSRADHLSELYCEFPDKTWHKLYELFGGGPVCLQLRYCFECQQRRTRMVVKRTLELSTFSRLQKELRSTFNPADYCIFCLSERWYRQWEDFVTERAEEPPGPINNSDIIAKRGEKSEHPRPMPGTSYVHISRDMWHFFLTNYGGGPEVTFEPSSTRLPLKLPFSRQLAL